MRRDSEIINGQRPVVNCPLADPLSTTFNDNYFTVDHNFFNSLTPLWCTVPGSSVATVELASRDVPILPVRPGAVGEREHFHPHRDRDRSPQGHSQSTQVRHLLKARL